MVLEDEELDPDQTSDGKRKAPSAPDNEPPPKRARTESATVSKKTSSTKFKTVKTVEEEKERVALIHFVRTRSVDDPLACRTVNMNHYYGNDKLGQSLQRALDELN